MKNNVNGHVAILGAGGWGTALALAALRAEQKVCLWARRSEFAEQLRHDRCNTKYLPKVPLPSTDNLHITSQLEEAIAGASLVLLVVPSVGMPELLQRLHKLIDFPTCPFPLVLCAKGLAPDGQALSVWTNAQFGHMPSIAVLSGPNHAEEVGLGLPAATVVASQYHDVALAVQQRLTSSSLRVYTSSDVVGVELGGVFKNVMAVAAGMGDGLALGDNAKASLLTRGLREMNRYLESLGAHQDTVYGLSGLGDLMATATSVHSRNRAAGEALARGQNPEQGGKVVEGLRTARLLDEWATQHAHDLPVVTAVARIIEGRWNVEQGLSELMNRDPKAE